MPTEASLRVILDQTAKLHRLYRFNVTGLRRNQAKQSMDLKAFQQLVVEVVAVGQTQAARSSPEALVRSKRINAEDVAH